MINNMFQSDLKIISESSQTCLVKFKFVNFWHACVRRFQTALCHPEEWRENHCAGKLRNQDPLKQPSLQAYHCQIPLAEWIDDLDYMTGEEGTSIQ